MSRRPGVAVLGSFMMDLAVRVARRPEPGETVVGTSFERFFGGKGCNQALAAARAGAPTAMIGRLGADDFGRGFLDLLAREGIDASCVTVDATEGTGIGAPVVEDSGDNSIVVIPLANHRVGEADVDAAAHTIAAASVLLLQLELPLEAVIAAATQARCSGTTVVLNPAPAVGDLALLAGCIDVLVPNEGEAAQLSGIAGDPAAAGAELQRRLATDVVITLGDRGVIVLHGEGAAVHLPAHSVDVVDTVGAGDAFCGALGARLAQGDGLVDAARYANAAAALAVTRRGAEPSIATAGEIDALLLSVSGVREGAAAPSPVKDPALPGLSRQ